MAYIQLHQLWKGENRCDIRVVEPVAGIDLNPGLRCDPGSLNETGKFGIPRNSDCLGISPRMKFDNGSTQ